MSLATKLYVGNLPEMVKDKELRDLFQSFGDVSEVAVLGGYGFVHFHKSTDANAAVDALDGSDFMDSRLLVQFSKTKGHGYGRGSGPPRPRGLPPPRGSYRRDSRERDRDGYRRNDSGSYRENYRSDSYRDRYRSDSNRDRKHDYDRYSSSNKSRYGDKDYDRADPYYDDLGSRKYSDSRGRSRSPVADYSRSYDKDRDTHGRDHYRDSHDSYRDRESRDSYRDYKRESYRDSRDYRDRDNRDSYRDRDTRDSYRDRDTRDSYRDDYHRDGKRL